MAQTQKLLADFGGLIPKKVKGYVFSIEDAQNMIKAGEIVHPRGTGHSFMGKGIVENAYIFTPEDQDIVFENGLVTASGGTTLFDIDNFLEPLEYMLSVSPDHRVLSLSGVLSVGGFAPESLHRGGLIDHVVSMDIMMKDGNGIQISSFLKPNFN